MSTGYATARAAERDIVSPMQRQALVAMLQAPNNTIQRVRGGYAATHDDEPINVRTINALEGLGLVEGMDPYRDRIRLTRSGVAVAEGRV